jgi:hypothetical protein
MKRIISLSLSLILIIGLIVINPKAAKAEKLDDIIGTTPNGTPVTAKQAIEIQDKLDKAMKNAYKKNISLFNDNGKLDKHLLTTALDNANYLDSQEKDNILQLIDKLLEKGKNIVSFSATTYFVTEDEFGIMTPLTKEEIKIEPTTEGNISIQNSNEYSALTVMAIVLDNGSTSQKRKYEMYGSVIWKTMQSDLEIRDNAIGIRWAGGEAIIGNSSSFTKYKSIYSDGTVYTLTNPCVDIINNGGVIHTMYGIYTPTNDERYIFAPYWGEVKAYVEQYGAPTQIYNMTCTYIYTWLSLSYSFSFGSGLSISVSPTTGTTSYVCSTSYGKGYPPY